MGNASHDSSCRELPEASDGSRYFNLTAANHEIIGTSKMYSSKSNELYSMQSNATKAVAPLAANVPVVSG